MLVNLAVGKVVYEIAFLNCAVKNVGVDDLFTAGIVYVNAVTVNKVGAAYG